MAGFEILIEDALASAWTKHGKGLKDADAVDKKQKSIDIVKGTFKIR